MRRIVVLLVGLVISIVALYYALSGFHLEDVWEALARMQVVYFLPLTVPYVLTFMTKVWRWRVLLHSNNERLTNRLLFSALMISYIPFPFRAGEVARGVVVSAKTGIPAARVFSTILVEKVLDVLTLLLMLGLVLPFISLPRELQGSATGLGVVFLVTALALLALVLRPNLARRLAALAARLLPPRLGPRIEAVTEHALDGLTPMSDPRVASKAAFWSLVTWSVNTIAVYFLMLAFNVATSPLAPVMLMIATNLGMAIPSAPGYIGTFEFVVVAILGVLSVPRDAAQAFALVYHFIALVPVATMGAIAALQQGVGLAALVSGGTSRAPTPVRTAGGPPTAPTTLATVPIAGEDASGTRSEVVPSATTATTPATLPIAGEDASGTRSEVVPSATTATTPATLPIAGEDASDTTRFTAGEDASGTRSEAVPTATAPTAPTKPPTQAPTPVARDKR